MTIPIYLAAFDCPQCKSIIKYVRGQDKYVCARCGHICMFTTDFLPKNPRWATAYAQYYATPPDSENNNLA